MNTGNSTRPASRLRLAGALLLLGTLAGGCAEEPTGDPRFSGGTETLGDLGEAVWDALVRRDTATLEALRLTEREHNELVWPEQPAASEPTAAANLDLWWQNIQNRNRAAMDDLLRKHGGSDRQLRGVACIEDPRQFESYRALAGCRLLLETASGVQQVEAFRYVIEMDGVHKVLRYYEDQ